MSTHLCSIIYRYEGHISALYIASSLESKRITRRVDSICRPPSSVNPQNLKIWRLWASDNHISSFGCRNGMAYWFWDPVIFELGSHTGIILRDSQLNWDPSETHTGIPDRDKITGLTANSVRNSKSEFSWIPTGILFSQIEL